MERFINILLIGKDAIVQNGLKEILSGGGNNILTTDSIQHADKIIRKKEVGIIIIDIDGAPNTLESIKHLKDNCLSANCYIIIVTTEDKSAMKLVRGMNQGAVDYLTFPFNPNLVKTKIEVFKTLYYKDQRIGQLLSNIFPPTVLEELSANGKFSPKRIENCAVLFTDFVDFSLKAKEMRPLHLIQQLGKYFTKFDEIINKYHLEKIKTIGDAYMVVSGVLENEKEPVLRTCLAAIEIRDFIRKERDIAIALKKDFWEIRVGIHMGPLVAGIIGSSKFSFDVWGDTVNIAARAEAMTKSGSISITSTVQSKIKNYLKTTSRGKVDILKRGGSIEMFYLDAISEENSMYGEGQYPNSNLRLLCGLDPMDFEHMRMQILNRLKSLLPENLLYHDIPHSLNVEKAAIRFAKLEGISNSDVLLLRTAVLFHDAGFIMQYEHNEDFGIAMAKKSLPEFGYTPEQIEIITGIINATKFKVEPTTILEKIMCDADHDYLGRPDYHVIAKKLRKEMEYFGTSFSEIEWIKYQIDFLTNVHQYYTETALNIRNQGKVMRIADLNKKLTQLMIKE